MVRKGRRKGGKYEEGDVAVVVIPTDSREIVRRLQEIVDFPEQEVYRTFVHCRRNPHEAIARLLAQAEEAKTKQEEKEEETSDSCSQEVDSIIEKGECSNAGECDADESSNAQGTVMASSSTTAGILGPYKSDETNIVPRSSVEAVPSISEPSSSDLTNGETEVVSTSSAEALPSIYVPSSSDLTIGEAEIVTTSSAEAVPSISVPSSPSDLTNVGTKKVPKSSCKTALLSCHPPSRLISATPEQRTMADVVKMSLGLSKESVTTATLKDDDPSSNSLIESATTRDQLQDPASVSNQDLCDEDVTSTFSHPFIDSAAKSDQLQESTTLSNQNLCGDNVDNPFSNSYPESSSISNEILRDQLRESASVFNQNLHDNSLSYLFKSFIEYDARQDQLLEYASVSNQKLRDDDVTNPFSYSFVEAAAGRNQLCESTSQSNQNLHNDYGGSRLFGGEDNNKNDRIYQVERRSFELNQTKDLPASIANCLQQLSIETDEPEASVKDDEPTHQQVNTSELPLLIFGTYGSGQATNFLLQSSNDDSEAIDDPTTFVTDNKPHHQHVNTSGLQHLTFGTFGSAQLSSFPSQSLNDETEDAPDFADEFSLKDLITSYGEEEQVQRRNVTNEQMMEQLLSQCLDQYRSSSARDFTFDRSQWLAPSKPTLRMQSVNDVLEVTHQQADIREPDSLFSAFPFNQPMPTKHSITTASSTCRRSPVSITKALNLATTFELQNNHYSQPVHYSNMMNRPYSLLNQNDSYNCSPSAFQQHGGSKKSIYRHQTPASVLPPYRNSYLPRSIAPIGPTSNGFGDNHDVYHHLYLPSMRPQYRNINLPQSYVPPVPSANSYDFGTSSYDTVDWRFNDNSNLFSPIMRQSANSSLCSPQRRENPRVQQESKFQRFFLDLENQKSPIFRHSQSPSISHSQSPSFSHSLPQGQEELYRDLGQERRNPYFHRRSKTTLEVNHLTNSNKGNGQKTSTNHQKQPIYY